MDDYPEFELAAPPPAGTSARDLWLQHVAGYVLFRDVREYALQQIEPGLGDVARAAAEKAANDAVYGLMMAIDNVTGAVGNETDRVCLRLHALLQERAGESGWEVVHDMDLNRGDGFCIGYHGWLDNDFGEEPVMRARI